MGKNVYITESQFETIISKKHMLNEHVNEIWQLDTAIQLIDKQWQSPDDFWYVYIAQRGKDNLGTFHKIGNNDNSAKFRVNFIGYGVVSGNTKNEAIDNLKHIKMTINRSYQDKISNKGRIVKEIESPRDLSAITFLCNKFNARCYMTINKRSMTDATNYANSLKQRGREPGAEFQFAAGRQMDKDDANVKWTQVRPWGLIDCDIDDKQAQQELEQFLAKNGITPEAKYESHDGMHYLFSTRDAQRLNYDYFDKKYRNNTGRRNTDPMVLFKGDACMLLYSACGY